MSDVEKNDLIRFLSPIRCMAGRPKVDLLGLVLTMVGVFGWRSRRCYE